MNNINHNTQRPLDTRVHLRPLPPPPRRRPPAGGSSTRSRATPRRQPARRTSTRTGAPAGALAVTLVVGLGAVVVQRIAGVSAVNAFFYPGTIGVLSLLVAYIVTNLGAIRYLFIAARRAPLYEIVCPIIGIAFLGYTLYKNVSGVAFPYNRFWIVVAAWLLTGLAIVALSPGLAKRIGISLAREEGLEPTRSDRDAAATGPVRTRARRPARPTRATRPGR